ncbi:TPA: hypothetical protein RMI67_004086 [Bacillus cereus]|nr:hypothetical protein [Bacillus cereus]
MKKIGLTAMAAIIMSTPLIGATESRADTPIHNSRVTTSDISMYYTDNSVQKKEEIITIPGPIALIRNAIVASLHNVNSQDPWIQKMTAKIGPNASEWLINKAHDISRMLDKLPDWTRDAIESGLRKIGVPPGAAETIATMLVFFSAM